MLVMPSVIGVGVAVETLVAGVECYPNPCFVQANPSVAWWLATREGPQRWIAEPRRMPSVQAFTPFVRVVTDAARHFATFGLAPAAASSMRVITYTPTPT